MAHIQYFPVEVLLLQEELCKHPDLLEHMESCDSKYMEDRIAHLCTALDILVDDTFDANEFCALCTLVTKTMYEKRTGLVITH